MQLTNKINKVGFEYLYNSLNLLLEKISFLEKKIFKQEQTIVALKKDLYINNIYYSNNIKDIKNFLPATYNSSSDYNNNVKNLLKTSTKEYSVFKSSYYDELTLDFNYIKINCNTIDINAKSNVSIKGKIITLN